MLLTQHDIDNHRNYTQATANRNGNLHDIMAYVMLLASGAEYGAPMSGALYNALCKLELEVSFHEPASPPFHTRKERQIVTTRRPVANTGRS